MRLPIADAGANKKIPLTFYGFLAVLLLNYSSSTEWRGISNSEFQQRSLKLENDRTNKVQSPEPWRTKQKWPVDSLTQASNHQERVLSLGAEVEKDSTLKLGLSKSFKPSSIDKRKSDEQASPATTRSPYVLEIRYDDDNDHKHSGFLDLMGAGTRAKEKVPPEVIQVPLAGAAYGHIVPSSSAFRGNVEHRAEFPHPRNVTSILSSTSANTSNSSNVILLVNPTNSGARAKAHGSQVGEVQYHPHIPYEPQHNVNESKTVNFKASSLNAFRQSLPEGTDAPSSTVAPQPSGISTPRVPKKIVTKISPLGNSAADAFGANAKSKPLEVSGYQTQAQQVQVIDLGTLGHDPHMKPHALLEEMRKLIAAHTPTVDNSRSSLVLFHKNKESMSQGNVRSSHGFPPNENRPQISTKLELPVDPNQTPINSSPPNDGSPASSSLLTETVGNSLYVQSVTPSSALGTKPNQDFSKDIPVANGAETNGLENPKASNDEKVPIRVKFHNKLIPVTAFIDPKTAPLPGVHFVLNPWVYKFPPWFEPHNPPPPGASSNFTDLLQGDIILDLEGIQDATNGDELVNVRVPSFSRFKNEVIRTILEANLKDRARRGKAIDHKLSKKVGGNSIKSEVASETHPEKVVSVFGDTEMNMKLSAIEHSIDHDLSSNKEFDFHSGESQGSEHEFQSDYGSQEQDFGSQEHDVGTYHRDDGPEYSGPKFSGGGAPYEESVAYSPDFDGSQSGGKYEGSSLGNYPHKSHKNSETSGGYHDGVSSSGDTGSYFHGGNFGSGEEFAGEALHSGEDFEAYEEQTGSPYDSYPSAPVYGTPHYHIQTPYNSGYPGSKEEADIFDVSEYNDSGEKDSSHESENYNDGYFPDHTRGAKEPVYTSHYSGDDTEAPNYYGSSKPSAHFESVDSDFHHPPPIPHQNQYIGGEYHGGDSQEQHESVASHHNEPSHNPDSSDSSHNYNSGGSDFHPHKAGGHSPSHKGGYRDANVHSGGGRFKNYHPKTSDQTNPHTGGVNLKSNSHHNSGFDGGDDGKISFFNGKVIFRDDIPNENFGKHGVHSGKDNVAVNVGQFLPSGYRHPALKPFKPSPPDPTSLPSSSLNERPLINHSPPGRHLAPNYRRPNGYAYKDKFSSVFVSKPQYLRSIYGPPDNFPFKQNSKHAASQKPFSPSPTFNSNYILTPQKYYYNDHRSRPVMSSGHAVTYWVPSKHNFYRSPSRRHDLGSSGSTVTEEALVVGVHPATREDIGPSSILLPPAMRMSETHSKTLHLSEGLDLLPYFNSLLRNRRRKNKVNVSIPMSYSGTSLRNVSAIVDGTSNDLRTPLSYRKSKERSSAGISVDIIYGSRKNSGPMSPDMVMKSGSSSRFSTFILSEKSAHESKGPQLGGSSQKFMPKLSS